MTRKLMIVAFLLLCSVGCEPCFGASLDLQGDLGWTGEATSDGDSTWPAELEVTFHPSFETTKVHLSGMPYSGSWIMQDLVMTTETSRLFTNGSASLEIEMNPLSELSNETLANITNIKFDWAHPMFNDPMAPTSWLTLEGQPTITIPEPSAWSLLGMAGIVFLFVVSRLV